MKDTMEENDQMPQCEGKRSKHCKLRSALQQEMSLKEKKVHLVSLAGQ